MVSIRLLLIAMLFISSLPVWGQQNQINQERIQLNRINSNVTELDQRVKQMARDEKLSIQEVSQTQSQRAITHRRFQVSRLGIPVEGATILTHGKGQLIEKMNGHLPVDGKFEGTQQISKQTAIEKALQVHNGNVYAWEDENAEATLQEIEQDPDATFYPSPELVYVDPAMPNSSGRYRLAYKFDVYSLQPHSRQEYYIDAATGEVLQQIEQIHTTSVEATAKTKYSGTQTIIVDSIGPYHYELFDSTRGNGIETRNMRNSFFYDLAVPFTDSNKVWDNFNQDLDEVATDAHWGMEMTYDYFDQTHNWKSFDNEDGKMVANVHFGPNYANATWNGHWTTYGDGIGPYDPFTSVDVVAHEFTHGVIDYTSDLIYRNEPGALNESFCDIFGNCIEYFAKPADFSWNIGEDFINNGIRSMSNPKSQGNPGTYKGQYWVTGNFDNGGVHFNSGVQNKWFYLLVEGGTGVNDNGDTFSVEGIGMDSAAAIAFYNLRYYLSRFSQYEDARWGSIQATIELYGPNSPAIASVMDAWYAVGLGQPSRDYDLELTNLISPDNNYCQLGSGEMISVRLTMNSMNDTIFPGDSLKIGYQLAAASPVAQHVTLQDTLFPFDRLTIDSLGTLDLSAPGKKQFEIYVNYAKDVNNVNDTFRIEFNTAPHQTTDIAVRNILINNNDCINPEGETIRVRLRYYGCDSFPAADIPVNYTLDGNTFVYDTVHLEEALYPGQNYDFTFDEKLQLQDMGTYEVTVNIDFPNDSINQKNNSDAETFSRAYTYQPGDRMTFENINGSLDSVVVNTSRDASVLLQPIAANKGFIGMVMTGVDIINQHDDYSIPDSSNVWERNGDHNATACYCVDASNYEGYFALQYDLMQTYSPYHQDLILKDLPYASSFRVLADGKPISATSWPTTHEDDTFRTYVIPLDTFTGKQFELCFQTRNFIGFGDDISSGKGDNAFLDQVIFRTDSITTGIKEFDLPTVNLYPNPVNNEELYLASSAKQLEVVEIIGVDGKRYQAEFGSNGNALQVAHLPSGYYLLRLKVGDQLITEKFTIAR